MNLTDYHAKYFAYELTRRCPPDSVEKLAAAPADAQVDLNPHQIDAALSAFKSPLSKGPLLADGPFAEPGVTLHGRFIEEQEPHLRQQVGIHTV